MNYGVRLTSFCVRKGIRGTGEVNYGCAYEGGLGKKQGEYELGVLYVNIYNG